jgi:hypothetical protein
MTRASVVAASALFAVAVSANAASPAALDPVPHNAQTAIVRHYLGDLERADFAAAYALLNGAARAYYRDSSNFASVFDADDYRITAFTLLGARGDDVRGRVYFARESARFRDHAHDANLTVTATVPVGVLAEHGAWRIKDPGHPWRAFAPRAAAAVGGVRVSVKKVSFFERRIETVVTFVNTGDTPVTVLPYGRSVLRDTAGRRFEPIATRDWTLTDRTLFEGLRLPPNARYTGMIAFACDPLTTVPPGFSLTIGPLLFDGADAPFSIDVAGIGGGSR